MTMVNNGTVRPCRLDGQTHNDMLYDFAVRQESLLPMPVQGRA